MQNHNLKFKSDLKERCFHFSLNIIALEDILPQKRSTRIIMDQLIRSATSIGANLVEARASSSRREFKKFYEISLKSANETIYWLQLLQETKLTDGNLTISLLKEVQEIANMFGAGVIRLKSRN
ncbi:four helix bundle protein [Candidatus Gottesmanbacteria bacterium CG11_big_fil_rev_8_21_14_0_20_37_11]|uniref:Four helix bundle protein n=2 Tax=Candidatus Gottesmaniibacteriota TaxID=1752720 RepID=A0A1J4TQE7_9BACT|nr:MAG: hypothetical protein AUJ73_05175 [Candidatus Gottesmanbacteria bacterium CG1_02_37_22]PIR08951.1 MAG: four helix bundle protein [Candidatus Gottesmanbacteria bacterium CG11_big_fil_rev_8_21_14_0_20_37_11]